LLTWAAVAQLLAKAPRGKLFVRTGRTSLRLLYLTNSELQEIGIVIKAPIDKSQADDCDRIKELGYGSSHHIQMYGERFDIVSDPFPAGTGVAVEVTTISQPKKRTLRLPTSILVGLKGLFPKAKKAK
jgi:hypothetical protein